MLEIMKLVGDIASILVLVGGIFAFIFKESIKAFFARDLLKKQEDYKRELETYKTILLKDLEEYKMGIDVRRNMSTEISKRRIDSYRTIINSLYEFYSELSLYSEIPNYKIKIHRDKGDPLMMTDVVGDIFYFSQSSQEKYAKLVAPIHLKLNKMIIDKKPIDSSMVEKFLNGITELRKYLISEVFPDDPTVKEMP